MLKMQLLIQLVVFYVILSLVKLFFCRGSTALKPD